MKKALANLFCVGFARTRAIARVSGKGLDHDGNGDDNENWYNDDNDDCDNDDNEDNDDNNADDNNDDNDMIMIW